MAKNDEKKHPRSTEIDDFAKALLDKKTDLQVYKDLQDPKENKDLVQPADQETFSSALDALRAQRGQKPIRVEEREYELSHMNASNKEESISSSLMNESSQDLDEDDVSLDSIRNGWMNLNTEEQEIPAPTVEHPSEQKKETKETSSSTSKKSETKSKRSKKWIRYAILLLVLVLCVGAYGYKVYVYDPQNIPSQKQLKTVDTLKEYADEYGSDMLLEAEILEIIDLEDDYNGLLDKQKEEVNAYFKEQTSKSFSTILKEAKELRKAQEDESDPNYQNIIAYLDNWSAKSEDEKLLILNHRPLYDGMTSYLQQKIDEKARTVSSQSFVALCSEMETVKTQREQEAQAQKDAQRTEYQKSLDAWSSEYNQYVAYGQSLQDDLAYLRANGMDTSEVESQISTNDQMIQKAKQNMDYYQNLINSLQ